VLINLGPPLGIVNANTAGGLPPAKLSLWSSSYSLVNKDEIVGDWYVWDTGWTPASYPVMFERSTAPSFDNQLMHHVAITKLRLVHKPVWGDGLRDALDPGQLREAVARPAPALADLGNA